MGLSISNYAYQGLLFLGKLSIQLASPTKIVIHAKLWNSTGFKFFRGVGSTYLEWGTFFLGQVRTFYFRGRKKIQGRQVRQPEKGTHVPPSTILLQVFCCLQFSGQVGTFISAVRWHFWGQVGTLFGYSLRYVLPTPLKNSNPVKEGNRLDSIMIMTQRSIFDF